MKASTKCCSVAAWGNIRCCTGSDGLYISGSSRCFSWINRRTATTDEQADKRAPPTETQTTSTENQEKRCSHFDWQVTVVALGVKWKQLTDLLLFQWEGLHHAVGGEHELSNQPHWGGHQSEWKGGCCLRGSGSWLCQLWGVDDMSPRISQALSNTFPIIPVIYRSDL